MNWTKTRTRLLEKLPDADLPEEWQSGIDLRGAYLRGADLEGANLSRAIIADGWMITAARPQEEASR